jgi:hypothetical protein
MVPESEENGVRAAIGTAGDEANPSSRALSRGEREFLRQRYAPRLESPSPRPSPGGERVLETALRAAKGRKS